MFFHFSPTTYPLLLTLEFEIITFNNVQTIDLRLQQYSNRFLTNSSFSSLFIAVSVMSFEVIRYCWRLVAGGSGSGLSTKVYTTVVDIPSCRVGSCIILFSDWLTIHRGR